MLDRHGPITGNQLLDTSLTKRAATPPNTQQLFYQ